MFQKAVEKADLIEQVFASDAVEESIVGDWENVQIELGLKEQRETPRRHLTFSDIHAPEREERPPFDPASVKILTDSPNLSSSLTLPKTAHNSASNKKKTKNKMVKASRKKNRRK